MQACIPCKLASVALFESGDEDYFFMTLYHAAYTVFIMVLGGFPASASASANTYTFDFAMPISCLFIPPL